MVEVVVVWVWWESSGSLDAPMAYGLTAMSRRERLVAAQYRIG